MISFSTCSALRAARGEPELKPERIAFQATDTVFTNATRKCRGTMPKVMSCVGPQKAQDVGTERGSVSTQRVSASSERPSITACALKKTAC